MANFEDDSALLRKAVLWALQRDPEEREEYLDKTFAGRPDLRERAQASLDKLEPPPGGGAGDAAPAAHESHRATPAEGCAGRRIGNYVIRRELGRGGMGIVYLADDIKLSRAVALKAVGPGVTQKPGLRDRLRNEARVAAGLTHPGIATVYALEEIGGELYVACEFVPGAPLRAFVQTGPLPIAQVVDIGIQVARALAEAHTRGIVHRDIKPENVMKTPSGVVKILDFGLAKVENSIEPKLTQTGMVVGTPAYFAPEQLRNEPVDFRTDIFAVGLLLYELASGANPFVDSSLSRTFARIEDTDPPPLSTVQPHSVPSLDRVVATCLNKKPAQRYASTRELVDDLERVQLELAPASAGAVTTQGSAPRVVAPAPESAPVIAPPPSSRRWLVVHQAAMCLVYVAMLFAMWVVRRWLDPPWSLVYVFSTLAMVAMAVSLRLHLIFTAQTFPEQFTDQQAQTAARSRVCDALFAATQLAAAAAIGAAHPEFAMLLVGVSSAVVVGSFVIEPSTARAVLAAGPRHPSGAP